MKTPQPPEATERLENFGDNAALGPFPPWESGLQNGSNTLEESEAPYRSLFEANPHPMWIVDCETLRFLVVNNAAIEHYGYSQDEFLTMTLRDIRPTPDMPLLSEALLKVKRSGSPSKGRRGVRRHRKKNGQIIDVEISINDLQFQGRPAILGLVNDITDRRQAERTLHHIMEGVHCLLWQAEVEENGEETLRWTLQFASEQAAQRFLPLHVTAERTYRYAWRLARNGEDKKRTDRYGTQEVRAGRSYHSPFA